MLCPECMAFGLLAPRKVSPGDSNFTVCKSKTCGRTWTNTARNCPDCGGFTKEVQL